MQNKYKVPKRQWRKWSDAARGVFNHLYSSMIQSPWVFQTPMMENVPIQAWRVTAWNASWVAADAANAANAKES